MKLSKRERKILMVELADALDLEKLQKLRITELRAKLLADWLPTKEEYNWVTYTPVTKSSVKLKPWITFADLQEDLSIENPLDFVTISAAKLKALDNADDYINYSYTDTIMVKTLDTKE